MKASKKKRKHFLILSFILIVLAVLIIKTRQNEVPEVIIREIIPEYGSIQLFISAVGTVKPQNRLELRSGVSGRVEEILVREGQKVEAGEIVAWMSSTERAALLDAARARDEETLRYWQEVFKPTPLIAPIRGKVIVRAVEPGQTVAPTDVIIVLSDRLIVRAQIDEIDIGRVELAQPAVISLDAYPALKVKAAVSHISYESRLVDNITIFEVDILPETVPRAFRSGMNANVEIREKSKENILLIPLKAVQQDRAGKFVFLRQGEREPLKRRVGLGLSDAQNIEVISGLEAEDRVIVKRRERLPARGAPLGRNPFMPFGRGIGRGRR